MRIVGGFFNSKPIAVPILGPRAPVPTRTIDQLHNTHNYLSGINGNAVRVGRHEIDISLDDQSDVFTAECENFKSGQTWQHDGVVWLDPRVERQHLLLLEATAANLHGTFTKALKFDVAVKDCDAFDLVNKESGDFVREPYVGPLIASAIAAKRYSDIEWAPDSK